MTLSLSVACNHVQRPETGSLKAAQEFLALLIFGQPYYLAEKRLTMLYRVGLPSINLTK